MYCLAACIDRMNSGQSRISAGQGRRAAGPQGRELHRAAGLRTSIFGAAESRSALPQADCATFLGSFLVNGMGRDLRNFQEMYRS